MKSNRFIVFLSGAVLTVLIILSVPIRFEPYLFEEFGMAAGYGKDANSFGDITGDGKSEMISCAHGIAGYLNQPHCRCIEIDENFHPRIIDQINVPELTTGHHRSFPVDYNRNGKQELLVAVIEDKKLMLHVYQNPDWIHPSMVILLDTLHYKDGETSPDVRLVAEWDADGDGFKEILLRVTNGFPIYPRRNYRVDLHKQEVLASPATSAGLMIDNYTGAESGYRYFTGNSWCPGNDHGMNELPYSDMFAYAYAFDADMELMFEPVAEAAFPGRATSVAIGKHLYTCVVHSGQNPGEERRTVVKKRNLKTGTLIDSLELAPKDAILLAFNGGLLAVTDGYYWRMNKDLNVIKEDRDTRMCKVDFVKDLNGDGLEEFIAAERGTGNIYVWSADLDHVIEYPQTNGMPRRVHEIVNADGELLVGLDFGSFVSIFSYSANALYWMRWPYYIAVFGISLLISGYLFGKYRRNIELRYTREKELSRLQVLALKNQVDPHFTLNALNSIDQMYRKSEHEQASRFMTKLTRLVYATVRDSDKPLTSLHNELDFCRNYCALESFRQPDFDFRITVDEAVETFDIKLPKQFIFTHVENAIKHGLRPMKGPKMLKIKVWEEKGYTCISVTNNGAPLTPSAPGGENLSPTSGTRQGLQILNRMTALYQKLEKRKITYRLINNSAGGTTAEIRIERHRKGTDAKKTTAAEPTHK